MPTPRKVLEKVGFCYGLSVEELIEHSRSERVIKPRMIAYAVMRRFQLSFPTIGHSMERDHTTIMYGVTKAEREWPFEVEKIEKEVRGERPILVENQAEKEETLSQREENAKRLGIPLNDYLKESVLTPKE